MKYLALLEYDNLLHCDTGRDVDMKKRKITQKILVYVELLSRK